MSQTGIGAQFSSTWPSKIVINTVSTQFGSLELATGGLAVLEVDWDLMHIVLAKYLVQQFHQR